MKKKTLKNTWKYVWEKNPKLSNSCMFKTKLNAWYHKKNKLVEQ